MRGGDCNGDGDENRTDKGEPHTETTCGEDGNSQDDHLGYRMQKDRGQRETSCRHSGSNRRERSGFFREFRTGPVDKKARRRMTGGGERSNCVDKIDYSTLSDIDVESFIIWAPKIQERFFSLLRRINSLSFSAGYEKEISLIDSWYYEISHSATSEGVFAIGMQKLCSKMTSVISRLENQVYKAVAKTSKFVFNSLRNLSSSRSRSHRSPVRSAAKSGGDGNSGDDGDSDQGEPPARPVTARIIDVPYRALSDVEVAR